MKIYDREGTPNAARVRIVVAAKGLDDQIDYVSVDLVGAEQKRPDFLARNPIGKTPLLELDDGLVISESTAITEYLDNLDGDPVLTGRTAREKAVIHMMQRRAEQLVMEPIDDYFHYGTPGLGPALAPWRMPDWPHRKDWGMHRGARAVEGATYFEALLQGRPFVAGDSFTMPDITLYTALLFAEAIGLPVAAERPALQAWRGRVEARPAVANRSGQALRPEDIARMS